MPEGEPRDESEENIVVFNLGKETYGLPIASIREIISYQEPTRLPGAPPEVEGIINLRGKVIPVVDLRSRLGLAVQPPTRTTRIIIAAGAGEITGLVVDQVTEVSKIISSTIEPPPPMAKRGAGESLSQGVAKVGERLIVLLDLSPLLVPEGFSSV